MRFDPPSQGEQLFSAGDSVSDPSPVAISTSATVPTLCGLAVGLLLTLVIDPAWVGLVAGFVFALVLGSQIVSRVRRRTLTVFDDVLVVQRDQYKLIVPWHGIRAVQRRRHQKLMNVEELVCSGGQVEAVDSRGRASSLPQGLEQHPALTRVMVSLYAKDWRQGPIGDKVRGLGIEPRHRRPDAYVASGHSRAAVGVHLPTDRRGSLPSTAAIARIDWPAARPREISSRSARLSRASARRRGSGLIPPQRSRYARTVPVHNPSSRAVGFAACPARIRNHTWSIASGVNLA